MTRTMEPKGRMALRSIVAVTLTVTAGGMLLGGCNGLSTPAAEPVDQSLAAEQSLKATAYYRLANGFDPVAARREYAARGIGTAKAGDSLFVDQGRLDAALMDLQQARAMDGRLDGLDAAADRLLAALRRLTARAKGLDSYFTMRGYLTDGYARAHREDPAMLADFDAVIAAYAPFAATAEQVAAREETTILKRMQSEGRMNDYADILIAQHVRAIRAATADRTVFATPQGAARADRLVDQLMPLLDRSRAAWAAAATRQPADRPTHDSYVIPATEQAIGAYRQFRRNDDPDDFARFRDATAAVLLAGG